MIEKLGITPGPWAWCGEEDGDFVVFKNAGDFICNVGDSPIQQMMEHPEIEMTAFDMTRANARLIAAAPLLYDYCWKKMQEGDEEAKQIISKNRLAQSKKQPGKPGTK